MIVRWLLITPLRDNSLLCTSTIPEPHQGNENKNPIKDMPQEPTLMKNNLLHAPSIQVTYVFCSTQPFNFPLLSTTKN
jgi:hypothetical protein